MLINPLAELAVSGSAAAAVCLLLRRMARGRLSVRWEDRMVKLSLFFALVPLHRLFSWIRLLPETLLSPSQAQTVPIPAAESAALPGGTLWMPPAALSGEGVSQTGALALPRWGLYVLAALWLLGALWVLLPKLRARRALERLVRASRPAAEAPVPEVLLQCRTLLGLRRQPEVRTSPAVSSPLVTGIFHPVILLPEQPMDPETLKCLLLHELDHIYRGDLWVRLGSLAALTIHWYNPLFHMLDRTVREVGEERCDEDVAILLNRRERLRYGQILLQMAAGSTERAGPWVLCLSSREALERRLSKMLHTTPRKGRKRLLALLAAAAVLSCGTAAAWLSREPLITAAPEDPAAQTTPTSDTSAQKDASENDPLGDLLAHTGQDDAQPAEPEENPPTDIASAESQEAASTQPESPPQSAQQPPAEAGDPTEDSEELRLIMETALRGDPDLILSRGGTLLPDDDPNSYVRTNGVWYKCFITKNTFCGAPLSMREFLVGNADALDPTSEQPLLDTLVQGEYPTNSLGESYGDLRLSAYVGYQPDLVAARKIGDQQGYISRAEEEALPSGLPAEECPHEFQLSLYDSEHQVIGTYSISCGGHFSGGMTIEEAKEAVARGEDLT